MKEKMNEAIKNFERLVGQVELQLAVAIEKKDKDQAHILAAAKIGLLNEIHELKVDLFKRELSEVR